MKTIEETYRERLKMLVEKYKTQAGLARAIEKSPAQISQWINAAPDSKTGKPRSLDSETARIIEEKTGMPRAWMDQPVANEESVIFKSYLKEKKDTITLELYNVAASCGSGVVNPEFPALVKSIEITMLAAIELFGTANLSGIKLMPPDGDSMAPTIPLKSIAFIDTNVTAFVSGGVYLISFDGCEYIKRLHRGKGGVIKVTSDNEFYKASDFEITPEEESRLIVHGKMWKVLPIEFFDI